MATITVGRLPDLTPETVQQVFEDHFSGKYTVSSTRIRNRDFIVKKSDWTGVGVRVKRDKAGLTTLVFTAMMPNLILQGLFGGLIAYLFLRREWKALEDEVAAFIQSAPQLNVQKKAA